MLQDQLAHASLGGQLAHLTGGEVVVVFGAVSVGFEVAALGHQHVRASRQREHSGLAGLVEQQVGDPGHTEPGRGLEQALAQGAYGVLATVEVESLAVGDRGIGQAGAPAPRTQT